MATTATTFHVRSGKGGLRYNEHDEAVFTDSLTTATRGVRQHSGWQSVTYNGKRYVLMGGIRTPLWINLSMPIKGRQPEKQ
jgi:hypothetical protein